MTTPHASLFNQSHFRRRKEDALDLLQWALDDMSPDDAHRLHLKMGIEREGHFVTANGKQLPPIGTSAARWQRVVHDQGDRIATQLHASLEAAGVTGLDRIYHDSFGLYLMELVTQTLSPKEAARATENISRLMLEKAPLFGVEEACFGSLKADFITPMGERAKYFIGTDKLDHEGHVFHVSDGNGSTSPVLAGCGQHCNVSLWCGDTNLFHDRNPYLNDAKTLGSACVQHAMEMMPHMMLPARNGNYHHIAAATPGAIMEITHGYNAKDYQALNWVDLREADTGAWIPTQTRMECRQYAPEADPLDVALATAIPMTSACLSVLVPGKDGKAVFEGDAPRFDCNRVLMRNEGVRTPTSEEEAAKLFNTAKNPNFVFLNELAEKKFKQAQAAADADPSLLNNEALRDAEKYRGIGTELHQMYCQQYGLQSAMTTGSPRFAGTSSVKRHDAGAGRLPGARI